MAYSVKCVERAASLLLFFRINFSTSVTNSSLWLIIYTLDLPILNVPGVTANHLSSVPGSIH